MGLKGKLIEFVVKHDLIPIKTRWKKSASGVGRLFNDVFHTLNEDDRRKLARLLHDWGVSDADEVVKMLKIQRSLHGCAVAILAANCIFGIKSYIATESIEEIVIHATECLWKEKENWTPDVCASIEEYDIGLVRGINKNVKYFCTRRRSKGDKVCEIVLRKF